MSSELGLFVLWSEARFAQDKLLSDIREHFEVRRVYEVRWSPEHVTANYARFYRGRAQPPYRAAFEEQKGRGPFLLVTVADHAPSYEERPTLKGVRPVNARFFDAKMRHREWIGGMMRVHATDSAAEARRDLTLLLGRDALHYLDEHRGAWDGEIRRVRRDLAGAEAWQSREQLCEVLGASVNQVTLSGTRPGEPWVLLTDDYPELVRVANARPLLGQLPRWGGDFAVKLHHGEQRVQIRFVGDGFIDPDWARALLDRRILRRDGRFVPCEADARAFRAYHALVHRAGSDRPSKDEVDRLLAACGADYTQPRDPTVIYDFAALGHASPGVRRLEAGVRRVLWRVRHRLQRPISAAWWRLREPLRRHVGWLRHLRPQERSLHAG